MTRSVHGTPANRAPILWAAAVAVAVVLTLWAVRTRPEPIPPDIVFLVVDTLRADHLPQYGYPRTSAANIGRLAEQGVVYERVIAPSSWTKTSMASIWTGRNALRHGVMTTTGVLPDDLTTLAESLRDAGYRTVGVNANPWLKEKFGFAEGFEFYETLPPKGAFTPAAAVNAKAVELARSAVDRRPVFLYVHYMDVHAPYLPTIPLGVPGEGLLPDDRLEMLYRKEKLEGAAFERRVEELYDATIDETDAAIGDLLARIELPDRGAERIVVLTSDHGEAFREHGTTEHGWNVYPEVYSVPLILSGSRRLDAGSRVTVQVRSIDIAPTLLELAGVESPDTFDGSSLVPDGRTGPVDRVAICSVGFNEYIPDSHYVAVVSSTELYIRERVHDVVEFYDLESDAGARRDLGRDAPGVARCAGIEEAFEIRETDRETLTPETIDALRSLGYLD